MAHNIHAVSDALLVAAFSDDPKVGERLYAVTFQSKRDRNHVWQRSVVATSAEHAKRLSREYANRIDSTPSRVVSVSWERGMS